VADDEVTEEVEERIDDENVNPIYEQRFFRLYDDGKGFPADVALQLAALPRIDTVAALKLLEKVRARGLDPEVASHILV
jgi:hypothetical protein